MGVGGEKGQMMHPGRGMGDRGKGQRVRGVWSNRLEKKMGEGTKPVGFV